MSAALMNDLRESLLLERARKIYHMSRGNSPTPRSDDEGIALVADLLRITRDEGIKTGLRQQEQFATELQKVAP